MKNTNIIITGDWHLREGQPICRLDNHEPVQWDKVLFIKHLQEKYNCPLIHAGDLFNHWKPSPYLLSKTIKNIPDQFYTIYGNHDLPQHNLELGEKSGIEVLRQAGKLTLLPGNHWGQKEKNVSFWLGDKKIIVLHVMTYQGKKPYPECTDSPARVLLKKYSEFDLIITGHNHQSFVQKDDDKILVNPGSITRQSVSEKHIPSVYLYNSETNTIERIEIPHKKYSEVISDQHIKIKNENNIVLQKFVENLNTNFKSVVQFEKNLELFEKNNQDINKNVYNIINKSLEL